MESITGRAVQPLRAGQCRSIRVRKGTIRVRRRPEPDTLNVADLALNALTNSSGGFQMQIGDDFEVRIAGVFHANTQPLTPYSYRSIANSCRSIHFPHQGNGQRLPKCGPTIAGKRS
jgi:hypothetical protein